MIDWEAVATSGNCDPHVKSAKMAECLADCIIPVSSFHNVFVPDIETEKYIKALFQAKGFTRQPPYVNIWSEVFALNEL